MLVEQNKKYMKYFVILFLLLIMFPSHSFSQNEIKGHIIDNKTSQPVQDAIVTVTAVGSTNIIYSTTADDGDFSLPTKSFPAQITVTVRAMNIKPQSKTVKSDVKDIEFKVENEELQLKEVIIKAPKIRQLGDTLNYNVGSFTDATDRSIGDVLKKLPGINVLSSGQILYQNKPINKFYIEGMDLLKGKYGLATNNIEASKVSTVQVLENHQPIKVLKGVEIPEEAAINLKLKKSALGAFFATAQVGVGEHPLLRSNELVGMRFASNQQNMFVYKDDNTGRNITSELESFYDELIKGNVQFLSVESASHPEIDQQHYLFNNAHMVSLNDLHAIKKDVSLTSTVSYLQDRQKDQAYNKQDIFVTGGNDVHIAENLNSRLTKKKLDGKFVLEDNENKHYINDELNVSTDWNSARGEAISDDSSTSQNLKYPSFFVSNDFSMILGNGYNKKHLGAFIGYTSLKNTLNVTPSSFDSIFKIPQNDGSAIMQDVKYSKLESNGYCSWDGKLDKIIMECKAKLFFTQYAMHSDMYSGTYNYHFSADSLRNDLMRTEYGSELSTSYLYDFDCGVRTTLLLPVQFLYINKNDFIRNDEQNKSHLLFLPYFKVEYTLNPKINLGGNISYSNGIGDFNEDYLGYMMTNYRSMNRNDEEIQNKYRNAGARCYIDYKNPLTTLFMSVNTSYSDIWRNTLDEAFYNGIFSYTTRIYHPNHTRSFQTNASVSKSIDAISSDVHFYTKYGHSGLVALNQGVVSHFTTNTYSLSGSIESDICKFMIIDYSSSYRQTESHIEGGNSLKPIRYWSENFKLSFIPMKKLTIGVSFDNYYNNQISSSSRMSWFGNTNADYKMKNVEFMLYWTNIFNTRHFITSSYNDASNYYSEYNLRPSEILLRVRFKLF